MKQVDKDYLLTILFRLWVFLHHVTLGKMRFAMFRLPHINNSFWLPDNKMKQSSRKEQQEQLLHECLKKIDEFFLFIKNRWIIVILDVLKHFIRNEA